MTALSTFLIVSGLYPQAGLSIIAAAISCLTLWNLVGKLKQTVWTFARVLEVNDTGILFDSRSDDRMLSETLDLFNHLISFFHSTAMELETRKLYYDRILKIMTHEMGNSITPVMTICADIRKHPEKYHGPRLQETIGIINNRMHGINRFLRAYHDLTHLPPLRLTEINTRDFMRNIRPLVEAELQARNLDTGLCRLTVSGTAVLNIDQDLMHQVIVNLLRNALDAVFEKDNPIVSITLSLSETRPYIAVEDNGYGIPPELLDELFQPFMTTKPNGTGVGLYLSRQIVRQHGGDLRLFSTPGKGTRVIIAL